MTISNITKIDRAWKLALERAQTSAAKEFYEEEHPSGRIVHASDVWRDAISSDPAQAVNDGAVLAHEQLILEEDPTVAGKRAWIARSDGMRCTDWIAPRFGAGYTIRLYDQNGTQIFTTDPCNWVFDYKAGILFLENSHPSAEHFKISGYRYIGAKGGGSEAAQNLQQVYDTSGKDAAVKLDDEGSLSVKSSDNTPLLTIEASTQRVVLRNPLIIGTAVKIETIDAEVKDNIITLNKQDDGQMPPSDFIAGLEVDRGPSATKPTLRWNNTTKKWQASFDDNTFFDLLVADQQVSNARKFVEQVLTPTKSVIITNMSNKVNLPGAVVQVYEVITGGIIEEVIAEIKWSANWETLTVNFDEDFTGCVVVTG